MATNPSRYHELSPPQKQHDWGWPAIANFVCGGAGAGYHCNYLWAVFSGHIGTIDSSTFFIKMLGPMVVALGLVCLPIEAGRPSRSIHLIRSLKHSWLSREVLFFVIFGLAALTDCFFPSGTLKLLSGLSALGFIVSQGFIVYNSKAVTAWNHPAVPLLFLFSAVCSGAGIVLLLSAITAVRLSQIYILAIIFGLAANAAVWIYYLYVSRPDDPDFYSATVALRRPASLSGILGVGHFLPLCLLLAAHSTPYGATDGHLSFYLKSITALLMLIGLALQKVALIHPAGVKRSIGFHHHQ